MNLYEDIFGGGCNEQLAMAETLKPDDNSEICGEHGESEPCEDCANYKGDEVLVPRGYNERGWRAQ
jgi:hypothetical protein